MQPMDVETEMDRVLSQPPASTSRTLTHVYAAPKEAGPQKTCCGHVADCMDSSVLSALVFAVVMVGLAFDPSSSTAFDARTAAVSFLVVGAIIAREFSTVFSRLCAVVAFAVAMDTVLKIVRLYVEGHNRGANTSAPTFATPSPTFFNSSSQGGEENGT